MSTLDPPRAAYDVLAPAYDLLTGGYAHEPWLAALERLARECGLRGDRVLDVGCGTGASFLPLLARGYDVTACDVSAEMVARARAKAGDAATVLVADMRHLPELGAFDLVTCLDDAINHLVSHDELVAAFRGIRRNLAPGGIVLFDVTTELAYRGGDVCVEGDGTLVVLRGSAARLERAGDETEVVVEIFAVGADGTWRRTTSRHRHRHHPLPDVERALRDAGLEVVTARGQRAGGRLDADVDENTHRKVVVVATAASERSGS